MAKCLMFLWSKCKLITKQLYVFLLKKWACTVSTWDLRRTLTMHPRDCSRDIYRKPTNTGYN